MTNRFYGAVGYATTEETAPDVWQETIVERNYYGNVLKRSRHWVGTEHLNDDVSLSVRISIVADPFAFDHYGNIRYVQWGNSKWKVNEIEPAYPRLILTLGELYHEQD